MNAVERRKKILEKLESSGEVINATHLAEEFNVTRQIIVSDIALLRANGKPISAERRGYYIKKKDGIYKTVICRHGQGEVLDEFYAIVDNGGKVLDVIIEHEIYGQIIANLILENRRDVAEFCDRLKHSNAKPLNIIAGGTHYHTVEARSEVMLDNIECALREKGYLVRA